jgi:glycosyltransferase involved in cell wall biosynthesis
VLQVLFLAHCTREKGLFDAVHAVFLANEMLQQRGCALRLELKVAGTFQDVEEKREFAKLLKEHTGAGAIHYAGFIKGQEKTEMLRNADILCFPSHWENQPVSVIEALAFGLPVVISNLPSVEEMMPPGYTGIAEVKNPARIAEALIALATFSDFQLLRRHFCEKFTLAAFHSNLAEALKNSVNGTPK